MIYATDQTQQRRQTSAHIVTSAQNTMWTKEDDISNDVSINKENNASAEPHYIMSDDDPADQPTSAKPYSYEQGTTKLGYDPIKEFPDVFPDTKPTELPPLQHINHKINVISGSIIKICDQENLHLQKHLEIN